MKVNWKCFHCQTFSPCIRAWYFCCLKAHSEDIITNIFVYLFQQPISGLTKKQSYYLLKLFSSSSHFHLSLPLGIHWPFVGSSSGIKSDIWLKSIKSLYRYRSKSHHYSQTLTPWPQPMCFFWSKPRWFAMAALVSLVKIPYSLTLSHININRSLFPAQSKLYFS